MTVTRSISLRRRSGDVVWVAVGLGAALVLGATGPLGDARPFSFLLLSFAAGFVVGRWRDPRPLTLVAAVAGGLFAVVLAVLAWQNTGCRGECNDTTGNAQLRVLVVCIAAAVMLFAWLLGAAVGRRKP